MKFKVGDKVGLNKNIKKFKYGRASVGYDEIGTITRIDKDGFVLVDFPKTMCGWSGEKHELVLINKVKFFKDLPNNFTGTLEVKNGYIVEKEILDDVEKEYLENIIKPFRNKVDNICKFFISNSKEYIHIYLKGESGISFPTFKKNAMYKGMKQNRAYSLEELGLDE